MNGRTDFTHHGWSPERLGTHSLYIHHCMGHLTPTNRRWRYRWFGLTQRKSSMSQRCIKLPMTQLENQQWSDGFTVRPVLYKATSPLNPRKHQISINPISASSILTFNQHRNQRKHLTQHAFHDHPTERSCRPTTTTRPKKLPSYESTTRILITIHTSLISALETVVGHSLSLWCGI